MEEDLEGYMVVECVGADCGAGFGDTSEAHATWLFLTCLSVEVI